MVLWDTDFLKYFEGRPVILPYPDERFCMEAIDADVSVLSDLNIIDYSLIVFFDEDKAVVRIAIIDYFRMFTWDKMAESKWKGLYTEDRPTIVSPLVERFDIEIFSDSSVK